MGTGPDNAYLVLKTKGEKHSGNSHNGHNPDEYASSSGGQTNVYFFVGVSVFFVFLGFLPLLLRKCGFFPSRARLTPRERQRMEAYERKSIEERTKIINKSLLIAKFSATMMMMTNDNNDNDNDDVVDKMENGTTTKESGVCKELNVSITSVTQLSTDSTSSSSFENKDNINDDKPCCQICLENFEMEDDVASSKVSDCQHFFHRDCIVEWLLKSGQCPSCRASYLELNDDTTTNESNSTHDSEEEEEGVIHTTPERVEEEEEGTTDSSSE
jgi:hypothetical protein